MKEVSTVWYFLLVNFVRESKVEIYEFKGVCTSCKKVRKYSGVFIVLQSSKSLTYERNKQIHNEQSLQFGILIINAAIKERYQETLSSSFVSF